MRFSFPQAEKAIHGFAEQTSLLLQYRPSLRYGDIDRRPKKK